MPFSRSVKLQLSRLRFSWFVLGLGLLALGGYPTAASLALVSATGAVLALSRVRFRASTWVIFPFVVASGMCLLQLVPLPLSVWRSLAPEKAQIWQSLASPPAFCPATLTPRLTMLEALKWAAYGALAALGARDRAKVGFRRIAGLGLGLALGSQVLTYAHGVIGATRYLGVYRLARKVPAWRIGPLLNPNHFAGLLLFGAFCALALFLSQRTRRPTRFWLGAALGSCSLGILAVGSRGAALALLVGVALVAIRRRSALGENRRLLISAGAVLGMLTGLMALVRFQRMRDDFGTKDIDKIKLIPDVLHLVSKHWAVGVGRGAFESSFWAHKSFPDTNTWTHPENLVLQWASEWGVPGALLLLAAFAWVWWRKGGWGKSIERDICAFGLLAWVIQNQVDFGLELTALAGVWAYVFGGICGGEQPKERTLEGIRWRLPTVVYGAALACAALFMLRRPPVRTSDAARAAYRRATGDFLPPQEALLSELGRMRRQHPAEPHIPAYYAAAIGRRDLPAALLQYNRALHLAPRLWTTHSLLAHTFARWGRYPQAAAHVKRVLRYHGSAIVAARLAVATGRSPKLLASMGLSVAKGGRVGFWKALLVVCASGKYSCDIKGLRAAILSHSPCLMPALMPHLRLELAAVRNGPECRSRKKDEKPGDTASRCDGRLKEVVTRAERCPSSQVIAAAARAEQQLRRGKGNGAVATLENACKAAGEQRTACLVELVTLAARAKAPGPLDKYSREAVASRCTNTAQCASAWYWAAQLYAQAGFGFKGIAFAIKGANLHPENAALTLQAAHFAAKHGSGSRAKALLSRLERRSDLTAAQKANAAALRKRLAASP